jgi:hypothetical protein
MTFVWFFLSVVLPDGTLQLEVNKLKECPDQAQFATFMVEQVKQGAVKDWKAVCTDKIHEMPDA